MTERLLPHSLDAERALLGSILIDNGLLETVTLDDADFYRASHRLIYRTIRALILAGSEADFVTVIAALGDQAEPAYITALCDGVPRSSSIRHYAEAIRGLARRRRFISAAEHLSEGAHNGHDDAELARLVTDLQEASGDRDGEPLRGHHLHEYLTMPQQAIPWAVRGWLADGDICMIAAEWGSGKSWLAMDLGLSLLTGADFLGCLPLAGQPGPILYIDEEAGPQLVAYRFQRLARAAGLTPDAAASLPYRYLTENLLRLDRPADLARVYAECARLRPKWIILDTLIRMHAGDENSNTEMSAFYRDVLRPLRVKSGAGIIALHHLSKPSKDRPADDVRHRARGASDIPAQMEQFWGISMLPGGRFRLTHEKCKWGKEQHPIEWEIRDVPECDGVTLRGAPAAQHSVDVIGEILTDAGAEGILRADLMAEVSARGVEATDRWIQSQLGGLCRSGKIKRRAEGKAARYWLAEDAPPDASSAPTTDRT